MKKALKRIAKRIFIIILSVFAIYMVISNIDLIRELATNEKVKVLIDSDPAKAMDDLFAIIRIMETEEMEVKGLLSSQWRLADIDNDSTVRLNTEENKFLLNHYHQNRVPFPEGNPLPLKYSSEKGKTGSEASKRIIRAVHELPYQEKLNVLCLGAATNLATAIQEKPEIIDKIVCYIQGPVYEPGRRVWDKSDPVTRLDLEAMNILLNQEGLEIHLLPSNIADEMFLLKSELAKIWNDPDSLQKRMIRKTEELIKENDTIPCPSLALVQAYLNPDMSTQKQLIAPPENKQRKIYVYSRIDAERMRKDVIRTFREENIK